MPKGRGRRGGQKAINRLTRPPARAFNVGPLEVDTLRPLVDLAYWSTFLEVRRDAAAAFATLSMNEDNLDVLSQAGALGALLALVGVSNRGPHGRGPKTDSQARFRTGATTPFPPRCVHHRPSCHGKCADAFSRFPRAAM